MRSTLLPQTLLRLGLVALALTVSMVVAACGSTASSDGGGSETSDELGDDEVTDDEVSDDELSDEVTDEGEPIPLDREALAARTWTLRFGGGPSGDIPLVEGSPITITFGAETIDGTAACNGYGGSYTTDGFSAIELSDTFVTEMACEPEIQASEQAFLEALADVDGINLIGDELALSGMATELIFVPAE